MKLVSQLSIFLFPSILVVIGCQNQEAKDGESGVWDYPLIKMGRLHSPLVEVQPFIFNGEFYLLENWRADWLWPGQPDAVAEGNDEMWIAHLPNGPEDYKRRRYISAALKENTLGTTIVSEGRVYVFGVNEASGRQFLEMTWSDDMENWSSPVKVFDSPAGDIFNVSITRDNKGFVFLWETDGVGTPFTMCFGRLDSLTDNWNEHIIDNACYGKDKYTGGPEVIYEDGWYYLLYLERLDTGWETRISRSQDLINWQDAPKGRPFITFNTNHKNLPLHEPDVEEINASDPGLTSYGDEVIVYFAGGIQKKGGDLQWAKFNGTMQELMESFFAKSYKRKPLRFGMVTGLKPEKMDYYKELHANTWDGVLKAIKEYNIENYSIYLQKIADKYYLFSYYEYDGNDYEEDMKKIAADTTTQRWWRETGPCQIPLPEAKAQNQIWTPMEEVFYTD